MRKGTTCVRLNPALPMRTLPVLLLKPLRRHAHFPVSTELGRSKGNPPSVTEIPQA